MNIWYECLPRSGSATISVLWFECLPHPVKRQRRRRPRSRSSKPSQVNWSRIKSLEYMANRDPLSGPGCEDMFLCGEYLPQYEINLLKKYPHVTYADIRKLLNSHRDQYDIPRFIRPEDVDFTPDFGWIHPIVQDTHKKLLQSILDRK